MQNFNIVLGKKKNSDDVPQTFSEYFIDIGPYVWTPDISLNRVYLLSTV